MTDTSRRIAALAALASVILACRTSAHAEQPNRATSLRVAIVLDRSGTYRAQSDEAVKKATTLLEQLARTRVNRWEAADDRIAVISLDAMPDVLWRGTLEELRRLDHAAWHRRLAARGDFEHCTDVVAAFRLATRELKTDAAFVDRYVLAFTDLIDEPPGTSVRSCKPPAHNPPADFPWNELASASVSVFWVPADQVLRWRRAAAQHGLDPTFVLHAQSESAAVSVPPPPRPRVVIDPAEQAADRARILGYGAWAAKALGYTAVAGAVAVIGLVAVARRRRTPRRAVRRPVGAHGPGAGAAPRPTLAPRPARTVNRRTAGDASPHGR